MFDYFRNNYSDDHIGAANTEAACWLTQYCGVVYDPLWAKRILEPRADSEDENNTA